MRAKALGAEHEPEQGRVLQRVAHVGHGLFHEGLTCRGRVVSGAQLGAQAAEALHRNCCEERLLIWVVPVRGHGGHTGTARNGAQRNRVRAVLRQQAECRADQRSPQLPVVVASNSRC